MSRRLSLLLPLGLTLLLATTAGVTAQPIELPGLMDDGLVVYDGNGVPHLCASSEADVMFLLGYVHAQDRFFQMDTLRRTFSGTLAEMVGASALGSDVQLRTLGLRRAAERSLAAMEQAGLTAALADLEAYTKGVNRHLQTQPLPPEYTGLELTSVPAWTVIDSLTLAKGLGFGLSFDLLELDLTVQAGAYAAAGAQLGFDGLALLFQDVNRHAPFDPTVSIPNALPAAKSDGSPLQAPNAAAVALAKSYLSKAREVSELKRAIDPRSHDAGSNWWLVDGENSATGYPLIANDPHLALNTPSTFYETHLRVSDVPGCGLRGNPNVATSMNANGVSFAGVPGLVQGCNETICWGSTVNPMDVTDVYQEVLVVDPNTGSPVATIFEGQPEPLVFIPQTFFVNQIGDQTADNLIDAGVPANQGGVTLVVPRRNNGPIIEVLADGPNVNGLSVAYTGWSGTLDLEAFRRWLTAGSVNEFRDALQYFDVGSQNWGYADVSGNIAYFTSAEMPIREDLQTLGFPDGGVPPFLIRDGTHTLAHEWLAVENPQPNQSLPFEILPFNEMPQVVNPAAGYIANANNDPIGTTLDNDPLNQLRPGGGIYYLSPGYVSLRLGRIDRELQNHLGGGPVSVADMKALQSNNELLDAELLAPYLIQAFANANQPAAPPELQNLAADPGVAEAITRLMTWDFSTPTGLTEGYDPGDDPSSLPAPSANEIANSVAATIWSTWRGQVVRDVIDGTLTGLGLGDFLPGSRQSYNAVANLLQTFGSQQGLGVSGVDFFRGNATLTQEQQRDEVLLRNLRAALDLLAGPEFDAAFGGSTNQDDYRWGKLHRIVFDHILGGPFSVPNAGGFTDLSAELPGVARSGGYEAVDASSHSARADGANDFMFGSGPARRFVASLDPGDIEAHQIIPGGQSGNFLSPNYASQLGRWLTNDYHPLLLDGQDVQDNGVTEVDFAPGCTSSADQHCFQDRRFSATVEWTTSSGLGGLAWTVPGASDASGNFWFFNSENWEILVKVLDACDFNDHYWVFAAGATNIGWELTVEDTETGETWTTSNPLGQASPAVTDTQAFATCP